LETAFYSGVAASDWSWGGLIFDADNNGLPDIFVCNGIYRDVTDQDFIDFFADELYQKMALSKTKTDVDLVIDKMPSVPIANKMFANNGDLHFLDKAKEWGLSTPSFSNGAAYGDLDNDGDLDLIVNNVNQPCFIYKNNINEQTKDHYIGISLSGLQKNSFALGSKVKVYADKNIFTRELIPTRGFQSSVDYKMIIGLGSVTTIDSLVVIWPNRTFNTFKNIVADRVYKYQQPLHAPLYNFNDYNIGKPYYEIKSSSFLKHQEDDYIDFYAERNIPSMVSREGPEATVADVNGDGFDDVYITGASMQPGQLYLQNTNGSFTNKPISAFQADANAEGVCALFFDADNDGDKDLFVGNGGNNQPVKSDIYANRLYLNDGKGNFTNALNSLPFSGMNTSCVAANDFDNDGDVDLFVGSRSMPGEYGETPASQLLINNGKGVFIDAASTKYTNIANVGLIKGAEWCNIYGGKHKDLVIIGEWMNPKVFSFNGTSFMEQSTTLTGKEGWWQSVTAFDADGDGDDDLLLGNIGENFYLNPTENEPVKLWINDFDNNGSKDKILSRTVNGRDVPVFTKRELTEQMPTLKKQNLKHADYAKKSVQDLFTGTITEKSTVKKFTYAAHCMAINNGNGNFTINKLPWQTQLSCVNKSIATDINNDGKLDVLIGSNRYDFLPQFCRLDAAFGWVLVNNGAGNFSVMDSKKSGLTIKGSVKDIKAITVKKEQVYLYLINNEFPIMVKQHHSVTKK